MATAAHPVVHPRPSRVLLVDDHADTTELLQLLLTRRGFDVTTARSVATAVAVLESGPVDVLVSDIALPDGSGCDLLERLRSRARLPAVAVSGLDRDVDIRRGREAGFDAYLTKPVSIEKLVRVLQTLSGASAQPVAL